MSVVHYLVPVFNEISTFQSQEVVQTLLGSLLNVPLDTANLQKPFSIPRPMLQRVDEHWNFQRLAEVTQYIFLVK